MTVIVPGITTLEQHRDQLQHQPERYRPDRCPHCGKAGLWCHGRYARKADRQGRGRCCLNPVWIPRFWCRYCRRTCSCLPECIAPRRWYLWAVQQLVLWVVLCGGSVRHASHVGGVSRRTVRRWRDWLSERFLLFSSVLRARCAALGRCRTPVAFWRGCLAQLDLAQAMRWLNHDGVVVP